MVLAQPSSSLARTQGREQCCARTRPEDNASDGEGK